MKTIFIIRHGDSPTPLGVKDFDRPLSELGIRQAKKIAQQIKNENIELFLSSPANRALSTASTIAKEIGLNNEVEIINKIYNASLATLSDTCINISDDYNTVAIYGHNPGFRDLVNYFVSPKDQITSFKKCGCVKITFEVESWKMLSNGLGDFMFYIHPSIEN